MNNLEYFDNILDSAFLCEGQDSMVMVEPAHDDKEEQRITIQPTGIEASDLRLYCFMKDPAHPEKLLPFFNSRTVEPNKAPKGLARFCDYVLLVQRKDTLYVLLLELKRGKGPWESQLDASKVFFEYIVASADRIKDDNFSQFDKDSVVIRRIKIKEVGSSKYRTKPADIEIADLDGYNECKLLGKDKFSPIAYCRQA